MHLAATLNMQFEDADESGAVATNNAPVQELASALQAPRPVAGPFLDEQLSDSMPEDDDEEYEDSDDYYEGQAGDDLDSGLHAVMDQDWADAAGGKQCDQCTASRDVRADACRQSFGLQTSPNATTG